MSGKSPEKVAEKKKASNGATRRELLEGGKRASSAGADGRFAS